MARSQAGLASRVLAGLAWSGLVTCAWASAAQVAGPALTLGTGAGVDARCTAPVPPPAAPMAGQLPQSEAAAGHRGIARAWFGSPTPRYAHAALGSRLHGGSLHVQLTPALGGAEVVLELPVTRVFEDRVPRLADLDGDGRDEVLVIEADAERGASLVVLGLVPLAAGGWRLEEKARGPAAGGMRWMNPVGWADFDGDGRAEVVGVVTPHIGGVLTLYRWQGRELAAVARLGGVSNHAYGSTEQRLGVVMHDPGTGPFVVVPTQSHVGLRFLRWTPAGGWADARVPLETAQPVRALFLREGVACARLASGEWLSMALQR